MASSQPAPVSKKGFLAPIRNKTTATQPFRLPVKAASQETPSKPPNENVQDPPSAKTANPVGISQASISSSQDLFLSQESLFSSQKSKAYEELGDISFADYFDDDEESAGLKTSGEVALERLSQDLDKEEQDKDDSNTPELRLVPKPAENENAPGCMDQPKVQEKLANSLDEIIESVIRGEDSTPTPKSKELPENCQPDKETESAMAEKKGKQTDEAKEKLPKTPRVRVPAVIPGYNNVNETIERVVRGEFSVANVDDQKTKETIQVDGRTVVTQILAVILSSRSFEKEPTSPGDKAEVTSDAGEKQKKKKTGFSAPQREMQMSETQEKQAMKTKVVKPKVVKKETKKKCDTSKAISDKKFSKQTPEPIVERPNNPTKAVDTLKVNAKVTEQTSEPVADLGDNFVSGDNEKVSEEATNEELPNSLAEMDDDDPNDLPKSSKKPRKSKGVKRKGSYSQEKGTRPKRKRSKSLSKPAEGETTKQRIRRVQEMRSKDGTWIECCSCHKWRYVSSIQDPCAVPSLWYCSDNPDPAYSNCIASQQTFAEEEESMVELKYSFGSLVWAQLQGYPWWPAMIDDDPDVEEFFWLEMGEQRPSWYHVVFFDRPSRHQVTRAWIPTPHLRPFRPGRPAPSSAHTLPVVNRLKDAVAEAEKAAEMNMALRRKTYSFLARYRGKWGKPLDEEQIEIVRRFVLKEKSDGQFKAKRPVARRTVASTEVRAKKRKRIEWIGLSSDEESEGEGSEDEESDGPEEEKSDEESAMEGPEEEEVAITIGDVCIKEIRKKKVIEEVVVAEE